MNALDSLQGGCSLHSLTRNANTINSRIGRKGRIQDKTGETVLHRFTGEADGANPAAGLIRDPAGNLYGPTPYGGTCGITYGCGVVFKLDTTGKQTVLYSFTGGTDGANPAAGLIRDFAGNLYGTTSESPIANGGSVAKKQGADLLSDPLIRFPA